MKRRTANAVANSRRGKKAEVRKWMLYYDRQEVFQHKVKTEQHMLHDWMRKNNRESVKGLQRIEELLHAAVAK